MPELWIFPSVSCRPSPRTSPEQRAYDLLLSFLNTRQRRDLSKHGAFDARGSQGGRYRILLRPFLPILAQDHPNFGRAYDRYSFPLCINLTRSVPVADISLAMLLTVTTDEARIKRIGVQTGAVLADDPFPPRYVRKV